MSRPKNPRRISGGPVAAYFKPRGVPMGELEEVMLTLDEFEALRLAVLDGMYQLEASEVMGVSRQTFARMVEIARHKVADAIVNGKALAIGGNSAEEGVKYCSSCEQVWVHAAPEDNPPCPDCGHELDETSV